MKKNTTQQQYVICLNNQGCEDLELRKLYRVVPDAKAAKSDHLRVVDESGEDYLYPQENFLEITLPKQAEEALALAS